MRDRVPAEMPVALMPQFAQTADKQALSTGFLCRNPPTLPPQSSDHLLAELWRFFDPVLSALAFPEGAIGRRNPRPRCSGMPQLQMSAVEPGSRAKDERLQWDRTYPFRGESGKV